jgi:hypothetical protein
VRCRETRRVVVQGARLCHERFPARSTCPAAAPVSRASGVESVLKYVKGREMSR